MTEPPLNLSDLKLALKRKGLHYKFQSFNVDGDFGESLIFVDKRNGTRVCGKIIRYFTEGEVYHWPVLSHENLAPLIDAVNIDDKFSIFFTIDREVTLKDIIHDEDFVHDPRCFERKKIYAKGIFSGLSYLHGKSLCLMNLSDSSVVICKVSDQAILTNFSDLACSRKIVRSKLGVPDLYKAPESEKGEFDATAAEIWAAGTLMLDMFLAHMVPWSIVNYKPSRIMDIVNKLSFELLQAANIGSVVSFTDLTKFKTFLKCFFKAKPMTRIAAKYAAISSFLCQNVYDYTTQIDFLRNPRYQNPKYVDEKYYFGNSDGSLVYEVSDKQAFSENCANIQFSPEPLECTPRETSFIGRSSPSNASVTTPKSTTYRSQHASENIQLSALEIQHGRVRNCDKKMKSKSAAPLQGTNNPSNNARKATENAKLCESIENFQIIEETTGTCSKVNHACQQSKYSENMKNENSFKLRLTRSCSNANLQTLVRESSTVNLQTSGLYLDRLWNEEEQTEERDSARETKNVTQTPSESSENGELPIQTRVCPTNKNNLPVKEFEDNIAGMQNSDTVISVNIPGIQEIVKNIVLLGQCQAALHRQPILETSDEFVEKQDEFIRLYQLLLQGEKMRLYDTLKMKYALKTEEIRRLTRTINVKTSNHYRCSSMLSRNKLRAPCPYSRFSDSRFIMRKANEEGEKKQISSGRACYPSKVQDTAVDKNTRIGRRHSYRAATQISADPLDEREFGGVKNKTSLAQSVFDRHSESTDKLFDNSNISSNTPEDENKNSKKRRKKKETKKSHTGAKEKGCKIAKKNKDKSKKNADVTELPRDRKTKKTPRRSFFATLCPGGKVQEPTPVPSLLYLCEACKLKPKDV